MYDEDEGGNRIAALRARLLRESLEAAAANPAPAAAQPGDATQRPAAVELYDADHYENTLVRRGLTLDPNF